MKNCLIILFLLSLSLCTANAQNYNCLQHGPIHYFTNTEGYLRGMRIDSVRTSGSDTIYYPFHTARGSYCWGVLDSTGGSWLGKKVIKQADGTFLFDNMWQDTVIIKTQAQLGDTWMFFNDTTQKWYTATLTGIDTMTVYGAIDSIKNIKITAYNSGLLNTADPLNNFEVKLSKNNGFVQVFDVFTFPYRAAYGAPSDLIFFDYYLDFLLNELDVHAVCNGLVGHWTRHPTMNNSIFRLTPLSNPSMMELYDVAPGDQFEYKSSENEDYVYKTAIGWDSFITKTLTPYSVSYTAKWKVRTTISTPTGLGATYNEGMSSFTKDTSKVFYLRKMPEEWMQHYVYHYFPSKEIIEWAHCTTPVYRRESVHINFGTCKLYLQTDGGGFTHLGDRGSESFGLGYRQVGHSYYSYTGIGSAKSGRITYANKSGVECGAYVEIVGVSDIQPNIADNCSLFPNPTQDVLNISSPAIISNITITDVQGRMMFNHDYSTKEIHINTADFPSGMYFIKINGTTVKKFVKQ